MRRRPLACRSWAASRLTRFAGSAGSAPGRLAAGSGGAAGPAPASSPPWRRSLARAGRAAGLLLLAARRIAPGPDPSRSSCTRRAPIGRRPRVFAAGRSIAPRCRPTGSTWATRHTAPGMTRGPGGVGARCAAQPPRWRHPTGAAAGGARRSRRGEQPLGRAVHPCGVLAARAGGVAGRLGWYPRGRGEFRGRWVVLLARWRAAIGLGAGLGRWYPCPSRSSSDNEQLRLSPHELAPAVGEVARLGTVRLGPVRGAWVQVDAGAGPAGMDTPGRAGAACRRASALIPDALPPYLCACPAALPFCPMPSPTRSPPARWWSAPPRR